MKCLHNLDPSLYKRKQNRATLQRKRRVYALRTTTLASPILPADMATNRPTISGFHIHIRIRSCVFPHLYYHLSKTCSGHIFYHVPTSLTNCFQSICAANIVRRPCSDSSYVTAPYKYSSFIIIIFIIIILYTTSHNSDLITRQQATFNSNAT